MALIEAPAAAERALVGAVRYAPNTAYLHRDVRLMPKRRLVWSSWNYLSAEKPGRGAGPGPVSVSYWMNRLQKIDPAVPLFVSLNPIVDPDPALVYRTFTYDHPQFDRAALGAQERLHEIQGQNRTWFCGAWTGHGFHEDGLKSGLEVAAHLGAPAPWGNQGHARIWRSPEAVAAE